MARYTVYDLDGFKLIEAGEIEAEADDEAVSFAKAHGSGDYPEIWEGSRKVRVVAGARIAARAISEVSDPAPTLRR